MVTIQLACFVCLINDMHDVDGILCILKCLTMQTELQNFTAKNSPFFFQ